MKLKSILIGSAASAALLFNQAPASAEPLLKLNVPFQTVVDHGEVGHPGDCPSIAWPLTLIGDLHLIVFDKVRDGVHHLLVHNVTQGMAIDADGNSFVFSYVNQLRSTFAISTSDPTAVNFDTDHFSMEGSAGHITIGFGGLLVFDAAGNIIDMQIDHSHGDITCDPI